MPDSIPPPDYSEVVNSERTAELNELYPSVPPRNEDYSRNKEEDLAVADDQIELDASDGSNGSMDMNSPYFEEIPPRAAEKTYNFKDAEFFKTSERILDDLRNDPFFLLSGFDVSGEIGKGILGEETVYYAERLHGFIKNSSKKYQALIPVSTFDQLNTAKPEELEDGWKLWTVNGIIAPSPQLSMPRHPLFHFRIKMKGKGNAMHVKHKFYSFGDNQLLEQDKKDLMLDVIGIKKQASFASDAEQEYNNRVLVDSIPQIIDSANYICESTGTILRIELYPSVFNYDDLKHFEKEEIELRVSSFLSQLPDNGIDKFPVPSTIDCLNTLFKVLKGPLTNLDTDDIKTLKPNNSVVLRLHLQLELLPSKLFFREINDELQPPRFSDLGQYMKVGYDYYLRALTEVLYLGSIFSPTSEFFKIKTTFQSDMAQVFRILNEPDLSSQLQYWDKFQYITAMTALSICPYYTDNMIIDCYSIMTNLNPDNTPELFDALTYCATSRQGNDLSMFVATLRSKGVVGFMELRSCFQKFGFDITNPEVVRTLTDDQLISSYKNNVIVSSTKYERSTFREALEKVGQYRESTKIRNFLDTEPLFDVSEAYETLETDPSVDDDVLITAFQLKAEDSVYYSSLYARALMTIALQRKSPMLFSYIHASLPQFAQSIPSLEEAYELIGCDQYADDSSVVRIFQERVAKEMNVDFYRLWVCLKVIGEAKKSKLIEGFLNSGVMDSRLLSVEKTPAGLNNIGNTCYLNSLLQYYFVIEPLRSLILQFNKTLKRHKIENDENYLVRRIGGRTVGYKEIERSYQFMYQLRDLYDKMIHENTRCVQPTRELAYLAFSPISDEVEFAEDTGDPEDAVMGDDEEQSEVQEHGEVSIELVEKAKHDEEVPETKLDDHSVMDVDEKTPSAPQKTTLHSAATAKISADQIENALEIGRQQDVTECIENVLIQIESALEPENLDSDNEQIDLVKQLFYGKTKQILMPVDPVTKEELSSARARTKEERFLNLIVNIGDHPRDIYDALDTYFTEDLLQLDNEEVKRSLTITELPKILQIQIQRVQFDRERLIPVKSIEPLPFKEDLYMDRYMETTDSELISKRKEVFRWKRQIAELQERRRKLTEPNEHGLPLRDALDSTRQFLRSQILNDIGVLVDSNILEVLDEQISKIDEQLNFIKSEVERLQNLITNQFSDLTNIGYSVFAIFIHRGQASYGHYWIYIRDPKSNLYRKYNDEIVSEVPIEEVLNFSENNSATPYYLVFVKNELLDAIQPLKREIRESYQHVPDQ
ncbi:hypothetical protein KL918_005220 [Ogataea parapolymorpha]|uniref:Ubiquitin carboxyl-terminal hydrolase 2 n=1 Tax=Ogataea parapolymorpha (strain ATCC 26012 / BCRC 20466 / JCM 22074 / NRRL Y-7560 / DL-1) TaxID=871575 RepID=W1QES0_OGAPD|nr:ubiquitin carboxyl-terminal hydrolase 25/28 [Ogataea parapolymorpha DL-1]ESX00072.1 ubiquitin carboxyl-terminal hydrolase 25/28 [Ogataea parapolymorpha DL-1]KAG7864729.1 hypothetical protein KL918_005220 [Ogataea parapolymorpha]KAG7870929.1 hypothetical protein KL916_004480 [Ogataea parapolymorpha]